MTEPIDFEPKKCFVIMPYGKRQDSDGNSIDFDRAYSEFHRKVVAELRLECERCDDLDQGGSIHLRMFSKVYGCGVAIADITTLNPNVMYELGVRHALVRGVTIMLQKRREKGPDIPFNIHGYEVIEYDYDEGGNNRESIQEVRRKIARILEEFGSKAGKTDSPVHGRVPIRIHEQGRELTKQEVRSFRIKGHTEEEIRLVTGELSRVKDIDVWVNPENTHMMMARVLERSVSSTIRYRGMIQQNGRAVDVIADELHEEMNGREQVDPATVLVTGAGRLAETNGVQRIFHVAAARGQPGKGFKPVEGIGDCVRSALVTADEERFAGLGLNSMLFPLMGTGQSRGQLETTAAELIGAAIDQLRDHPEGRIDHVYFLTWTDRELAACDRILDRHPDVDKD